MSNNPTNEQQPDNPTNERYLDQGAVRLFFVDETTGNPVAGLLVSILADFPRFISSVREPPAEYPSGPVATLQTDQAGYVSFKFDRSNVPSGSQLTVIHGGSQEAALVLTAADLLAGDDTHTIRFDASTLVNATPHLGLPAVMSPDAKDLSLSPGSIGVIPYLLPGGGLCRQLMPTIMGARRFQAFHILPDNPADICAPEELVCPDKIQIVKGKMLEYEIVWHPAGTSLGELLNTISLAPCEQVNVTIADWMRRETSSRTEATDEQQQRFEQTEHDRLVVETMHSTVKDRSFAWGVAAAKGSTGGSTFGSSSSSPSDAKNKLNITNKLDLTSAFGGGVSGGASGTASTQQIALNTTNQLSEQITRAASFVASRRSTVVFQATASEQQTYQTRTIRNHNHCHTLTLMYYQVNRSYRVVTDFKGARDVILVKFENAAFDAMRAYQNANLLKDALLDPGLRSSFDELADALFCCNLTPVVNEWLVDSLTMTFWVKETNGVGWWFNGKLNLEGGAVMPFGGSDMFPLPHWAVGGQYKATIPLQSPTDYRKLVSIVLDLVRHPANPLILTFSKIEVTGHVVGFDEPLTLYTSQSDTVMSSSTNDTVTWLAWLNAELPEQPSWGNECVEKSSPIRKLLGHLNSHKHYYNSVVRLNQDPNERVMQWSCCHKGDAPFNLLAQIENEPVTIYGDYVVFPVAGSQLVDGSSVLPVSKLVTMPTPGVYSEGILGQCDTCEITDPNRFWNWKDSPCTDNAPAATSLPTPETGVKPSDLKADAISNMITFSNVPDAPATIVKDLISTLLTNADGGSKEAKALLDKLLDTIKGVIGAKI